MKSEIFEELLKETPLNVRLQVSNEAAFICLLRDLGFREERMWEETEEDNILLKKIIDFAKEHTKNQLKSIKKWEEDGRPE